MNLKEELMNLPTVEDVVITKNTVTHGIPTITYKVIARHPQTQKLYWHLFELTSDVARSKAVTQLFKSYLNRWWTPENIKDSWRG